MRRSFIVCLAFGSCVSMIAPARYRRDASDRLDAAINTGHRTMQPFRHSEPSSPLAQATRAPTTDRQFYPVYPEYVPTGYEGYLVPASFSPDTPDTYSLGEVAASLLPLAGEVLLFGAQTAVNVLYFFFAISLGGALTTLICTYTPLCTISFVGFGSTKSQTKEHSLATAEAVDAAAVMVSKALEKYAAMQNEGSKEADAERTPGEHSSIR